MKVYVKYKNKKVQECDGCDGCGGDVGGDIGFGMGEVVPGGPDRFDLGFGMPPFAQTGIPNKKKKRIKLKKRRKK